MDLRQFFTNHAWWGKLIGTFLGFLMAGPLGAFLGLILGNFFDRGLAIHFAQPFWHYHHEKNPEVQRVFFEAMFAILGHFAKSDGHVSSQDIGYTNEIMTQMKLSAPQKKAARRWFTVGKSAQFNLTLSMQNLYKALQQKPHLIRLFVQTQYQFVKQGELTNKKVEILNTILAHLQLAPLYQHFQFAQDFPWYFNWQQNNSQQQEHQQSYQRQPPPSYHHAIGDPYDVLQIKASASKSEVKRAYRRQISLHHPDKLIAKGASASTIKAATEKTQEISKAYEKICLMKGW
ncbi:MAG: co-chaperone DjlA [Gammaproteobacteria bacterium]|nr:co-chaperone DjlA [Gammaproteobacteria bacterium]